MKNILKIIIINSPFVYAHLWFVLALLYCYIFCLLLDKKMKGKWKIYYVTAALLFFVLASEILPKYGIWLAIGNYDIAIYNLFFFRALPFYLLGIIIRENEKQIIEWNIEKNHIFIMVGVGFLTSIVERVLFVESQFYSGTYVAVFFIFVYCLKHRGSINRKVEYIGRNLSMYVYILHIAIMEVMDFIIEELAITNRFIGYLRPIILILASLGISYVVYILFTSFKKRPV